MYTKKGKLAEKQEDRQEVPTVREVDELDRAEDFCAKMCQIYQRASKK